MSDLAWLGGIDVLSVEIALSMAVLLLLVIDLALPHGNKRVLGWIALIELVLCFGATFVLDLEGSALSGAYVGDEMAVFFKRLFLGAGILAYSQAPKKPPHPIRNSEFLLLEAQH